MAKKDKNKGRVRLSVINQDMNTRPMSAGVRVREIDTLEYQQKVEYLYDLLKNGTSSSEAYAMMMLEDEEMTETKFNTLLAHAYQYAETQLQKDRDYVFQLHMARYEDMYQKAIEKIDSWGRELKPARGSNDWAIWVAKLCHAVKQLKSKEDLLGLHDKSVVLEFNEHKAFVLEKANDVGNVSMPGYDFNLLTLDEMIELLGYIRDSRTIPIEGVQRVTIKQTKIEINTDTGEKKSGIDVKNIDNVIDIKFEEMPPDVVSKFKDIPKKKKPKFPKSPIVIDHTNNPKIKGKTADQVAAKIQGSVLDQFKNKLLKKRGIKK